MRDILFRGAATLLLASGCFCLFMLARNQWVYEKRTRLLWSDFRAYERLASYDVMLWRFWVWDVTRFLTAA